MPKNGALMLVVIHRRVIPMNREMIKEKYTQSCLAHQYREISTIEFTQTLGDIF